MQDSKLILEYSENLNVLYVEDDEVLLQSTTKLFRNYFKHVDSAKDGKEALEKYTEYEEETGSYYDLIITDINMPKLNGMELIKKVLARNEMQAIMITTAYNEVELLRESIELGVDSYIVKPLEPKQLFKALFKVSKSISDDKFVQSHVALMEDLNLQLETKNRELLAKNTELEKSLRLLDTVINKEEMIHPKKQTSMPVTEDDKESDFKQQEQIEELISNDLAELEEIIIDIDNSIIEIISKNGSISPDELSNIARHFIKYSSILHFYSFFDELGQSMFQFGETIKNSPLPEKEENINNIFMLLESFIYVLSKWQKDISSGNEDKINQFDASIISDMHTITNMWTQKDEEFAEEDMDDIFDF